MDDNECNFDIAELSTTDFLVAVHVALCASQPPTTAVSISLIAVAEALAEVPRVSGRLGVVVYTRMWGTYINNGVHERNN